jgi:hypothetical protein
VTDVVNGGYRQPPGDDERRAAPSDELVSDEVLRTERDSSIAVKFVDGSELGVESQSEVVLSDYLFDANAAASTGTINLNSGLFHFNSNNVPDSGLVLKTPVATIGIRGTEFLVHVDGDDATIIDILDGKVEVTPLKGGKPVTCEGGQSILVESAKTDAVCGDLGAFSTAAAPPSQQDQAHGDVSGRDGGPQANGGSKSGGKSGGGSSGGDPGGGDPGGGDPGGGDPGGGDPGGPTGNGNHSGLGDGSNPGNGHGNGHGNGNGGHNNGGTNNPGGGNH